MTVVIIAVVLGAAPAAAAVPSNTVALPTKHSDTVLPRALESGMMRDSFHQTDEVQAASEVRGSVKDVNGDPLPDVTVTLTGADDRVGRTGPDGSFAFVSLPSGDYEMVATLAGFVPIRRMLQL